MTETPDSGYLFNGWGGACSGSGPSCAVYLPSDASIGASFISVASTTLTVTVTGYGSVTGGGISCGAGATCSAPEPANATVTLTAKPASGWVLTGWSNGCTGTQPTCTVQMSNAPSVAATFAQLATLAVTVSGSGTVTGGGIGCDGGQTCTATETPNTTVTLTANPSSGATVFWSGCTSTAGALCTVTIGAGVESVTATFSGGTPPPVATNALSLVVEGDGYVVSSTNPSVHCTAAGGAGCTVNVNANTTLTLTAVPASGAATDFTRWQQACASFATTTCTLTMTSPKTVEADFPGGNTTYVLTGQVTGLGTISGAGMSCTSSGGAGCNVAQAAGAGITLTATPSFGATFTGWSGACSGTSPTCAVSMTNAKSVTAAFATSGGGTTSETIALTVAGAGSVSGTGVACSSTTTKSKLCTVQATHGQAMTLTAKAAAGYAFTGWTGACSGKKATCQVTVDTPLTIGAAFARPALASTHAPTVSKNRVTLFYHSLYAGTMKLVARRSGKTVGTRTGKIKAGTHRIVLTMPGKGRYVMTLTVKSKAGAHAIRWRVTIK